jgi:hypothetical protein
MKMDVRQDGMDQTRDHAGGKGERNAAILAAIF